MPIVNHSRQAFSLIALLRQNPVNFIVPFAIAALVTVYSTGLFSQTELATFARSYADFAFLALIIAAIIQNTKKPISIVDPVYWLLLGTAFFSWFVLTILRLTLWPELLESTRNLVTNLCYFLYFTLTIAAIEVKSYEKAGQLLSRQSLLIWIGTLSFILGAFILLVLTATNYVGTDQPVFHSAFVFYLLMDCYLLIRWWHLAWTCRENHWVGFFLFGLGALSFAIADITEALNIAKVISLNGGTWNDWLWYIPYFFIYAGLQTKVATSFEQNVSRSFSRSHLFNSPLFFVVVCYFLQQLLTQSNQLLTPLNHTQIVILKLWTGLNLLFALLHLSILIKYHKEKNRQLKDAELANDAMQQRMLQQAVKLESQSASNKAILDTTHNAIFTLDLNGKILSCNPAACSLLGYQYEQLISANFIDILQAEGELARYFSYQSYRQKLATQKRGIELESEVTRSNSEIIQVHVTLSQRKNHNQGLLVASLINISEQKNAEKEAHQLKDQFIANISHEFRTPLTIINGVLDNLLSQPKYESDLAQLNTAKRNGLRMIRMVEQLLELSRIANDSIPISSLNAQPIIKFACSSFEEIAKNNQIRFNYQLADACWIQGNEQALEKILFNLLSNAFKYTKKGSVIVTLTNQQDRIDLSVIDTGIGINKEQQALIFERFHRVENDATHAIHGVGIGLSLVKELCDNMRWSLHIESQPDQGSLFCISIPKGEPLADHVQQPTESTDQPTPSSDKPNALAKSIESEMVDAITRPVTATSKKSEYSVLIVEDNQDMQAHINQILSPHHQCLLADNGEEGVRLAIDYVPDIIVSDVMMPGISGFELLKTLKKTEMTSHIPIILLTARSDSASKIRGLEAQADDYLSKPFDATELLLRVKNQLSSREKLQLKLNQRLQQVPDEKQQEPEIEDQFVLKLEQVFAENYENAEFNLTDLTHIFLMSERQLQRKIKQLVGVSPLEALKQFRLKQAKKRLEEGVQAGLVAQICGFSSQSYFGRCFKETFHMTPKQFQSSLS